MAFTRVLGPGIHTASNINSHNINSTGIITAVSFVGNLTGGASSITGTPHVSLGNVNAGIATFAGALSGTTANFSGNVTVGGVLTYEDVKNIDSIGIITARSDLDVDGHTNLDNVSVAGVTTFNNNVHFKLNDKLYFGNNNELEIYQQGNNSIIENNDDTFLIRQSGTATNYPLRIHGGSSLELKYYYGNGGQQFLLNGIRGAQTEIYYSGQKKFETTAKGIQVGTGVTIETNGQATYTGIITATAFKLADGSAIGAGAGGTWSSYTAGIATSKSVGVNTSNLDDNDLVGVGNSFQGLYISNGMMVMDNKLTGNHYIGTAFNGLMAGPVNIEGTLTIDGNYVVV